MTKEKKEYVQMPAFMQIGDDNICVTHQTVKNLRDYLNKFPDNADVVLWHDYGVHEINIATNYAKQQTANVVMLAMGQRIRNDG